MYQCVKIEENYFAKYCILACVNVYFCSSTHKILISSVEYCSWSLEKS